MSFSAKPIPRAGLPVTFYKATADLPAFTSYSMADRTYRYHTKPVLYPVRLWTVLQHV